MSLRSDIPDLGKECRELLVLQFEREAHLWVLVSECPQFCKHWQQLCKDCARSRSPPIVYICFQCFQIYLLNLLHFPTFNQWWPVCKKYTKLREFFDDQSCWIGVVKSPSTKQQWNSLNSPVIISTIWINDQTHITFSLSCLYFS